MDFLEEQIEVVVIVGFIAGFIVVSKAIDIIKRFASSPAPSPDLTDINEVTLDADGNVVSYGAPHTFTKEDYSKILGIRGNESFSQILEKYHQLTAKFHPTYMNQLSEDQKVQARKNLQSIDEAFDYFRRNVDR